MKILLFAGTSEGRILADYLYNRGLNFSICTATEYAKDYLAKNIDIISGRKDLDDIKELILNRRYDFIIDATHPYADIVTKNIKLACDMLKVKYLRVVREPQPLDNICIVVNSIQSAVDFLNHTTGNILLTTGVKNLKDFTKIEKYQERIFARILDNEQSLEVCKEYSYNNVVQNNGICSIDTNIEHLKTSNAKYLVTKESGSAGGFLEKIEACKCLNIIPIVISRPIDEDGLSLNDTIKYLDNTIKDIFIIGIGMGNIKDLSYNILEVISNSDVLIGAKRMIDMFSHLNKDTYISFNSSDISNYIETSKYNKISVLMSGDSVFFSGTDKLIPLLKHHNVMVYSGISSVSYLSSKLGVSWNDSKIISVHGRYSNYISAIDKNKKVFILTGGNVQDICKNLIYYNLDDVDIFIGENLSQVNEKISFGHPKDFLNLEFSSLSVMYVENTKSKNILQVGISDSDFIRGKVPMTKSEVRAVSISRCNVEDNSVCWDIGAGTGSISVEMALLCPNGFVYAVEKNPEGIALIEENLKKFKVSNAKIICDNAENIVETLPTPDVIFLGGSSGELSTILDVARKKNSSVRVVVNCITLETLNQTLEYIKSKDIKRYEISQVSVSRVNKISNYNMLKGENPVFIISF